MDEKQRQQLLLTQLIFTFQAAAMQQMGKIKNPLTDTVERDLAAAQNSIDLLDMLREKTKGNLSAEEERYLTATLRDLKLNFVDEANKQDVEAKKPAGEPAPQPEEKKGE
jgi:hypothetical protein